MRRGGGERRWLLRKRRSTRRRRGEKVVNGVVMKCLNFCGGVLMKQSERLKSVDWQEVGTLIHNHSTRKKHQFDLFFQYVGFFVSPLVSPSEVSPLWCVAPPPPPPLLCNTWEALDSKGILQRATVGIKLAVLRRSRWYHSSS